MILFDVDTKVLEDSSTMYTYNDRPIGTRIRSTKWYYFQWPWMTPNADFKVTPLFDAVSETLQVRDIVTIK